MCKLLYPFIYASSFHQKIYFLGEIYNFLMFLYISVADFIIENLFVWKIFSKNFFFFLNYGVWFDIIKLVIKKIFASKIFSSTGCKTTSFVMLLKIFSRWVPIGRREGKDIKIGANGGLSPIENYGGNVGHFGIDQGRVILSFH